MSKRENLSSSNLFTNLRRSEGPPSAAAQNSPWISSLLILVVLLFAGQSYALLQVTHLFGASSSPSNLDTLSKKQFESCDKNYRITFSEHHDCAIYKSNTVTNAKYNLLSVGRFDLSALVIGYLRRKEYWYRCAPEGLLDQDGIALYRHDASDLKIIKRMWEYANLAQSVYKKSKIYPSDAVLSKQLDPSYYYLNPITGKTDYAPIVFEKHDSVIDLQKRRPRRWRPGAILCLCVNYNHFYVQGFDREGKPFLSSNPARYFVIECKDGIILTEAERSQLKNKVPQKSNNGLTQVFVCETADMENSVHFLRQYTQLSLWTFVGIACLWWYLCCKTNLSRKFKSLSIGVVMISLLFLTTWYTCAFWVI